MPALSELKKEYLEKKPLIQQRLSEFEEIWGKGSNAIFAELAFCLCTPQSNAKQCDAAVNDLLGKKLLFKSGQGRIERVLSKRVRFHKSKACYIIEARNLLMPGIKEKLESLGIKSNTPKVRSWLVENVKGLGMKEASHFLRNIGFGQKLAILDRHIMRNLLYYGALKEIPKSINEKSYLSIEKKMHSFSSRVQIPLPELDLLFWSRETGEIFK